jgi:hypothetical protein
MRSACACGGTCPRCAAEAAAKLPPKLTVKQPGDAFEQEADRVADQVMRMPGADGPPVAGRRAKPTSDAPSLRRKCACGGGSTGCAGCRAEDKVKLRRQAAGTSDVNAAPPIVLDVLDSPGQRLDAGTRGFMESRFGRDFGDVRVHSDSVAAESAGAVGARAYTVGETIVFGDGEYRPGADSGRRLLAHELSHVVQQSHSAQTAMQRDVSDDVEAPSARQGPGTGEDITPQPMDEPNRAPSCADVCGEKDMCIREPREACDPALEKIIASVWQKVANNLTNAVNDFDPANLTPVATQSLKDNFAWSRGDTPADLPTKLKAKLDDAMNKISDNLCTKCVECPSTGVAQIDQRRGVNCTQFNCFKICKTMKDDKVAVHALTHELFHRVVTLGKLGDFYRGQPGYPGTPSQALTMPDSFASLIDDMQHAKPAATSPSKSPSAPPPSGPTPTPAPPPM